MNETQIKPATRNLISSPTSTESGTCSSTKGCRTSYYALSFLIPFVATMLSYSSAGPAAIGSATTLTAATLAGFTALALYGTIKKFRHRKTA